MNLETTKERVLEAAKQSDEVKAALKTLFPEMFGGGQPVEIVKFKVDEFQYDKLVFIGKYLAPPGLECKCLMLTTLYNWEITQHSGHTVLIPTTK